MEIKVQFMASETWLSCSKESKSVLKAKLYRNLIIKSFLDVWKSFKDFTDFFSYFWKYLFKRATLNFINLETKENRQRHNTDIFIKYLTKVSVEVFFIFFFHTISFYLLLDTKQRAGSEPNGKSVLDLQKLHH